MLHRHKFPSSSVHWTAARCPRQIIDSLTISLPFSSLVSPASLVAQRRIPPAQAQPAQAVALLSGWPLAESTSPLFSFARLSCERCGVSDHHHHIPDSAARPCVRIE